MGLPGAYPIDEVAGRQDVETLERFLLFYREAGARLRRGEVTRRYLALLYDSIPAGLRDRVQFAGHVTRAELPDHFCSADVFAFPPI